MDRVFILQEEYVNDRYNPDGMIYKHILDRYKTVNIDEVYVCPSDIFQVKNTIVSNAQKMNKKIIPVGTVEYVQQGLNQIAGKSVNMKPIEVPNELRKYTRRKYVTIKGSKITDEQLSENPFIKNASKLKAWNNLLNPCTTKDELDNDTLYVVSERVEFASEYRVFVHNGEILAIQHYLGEPSLFPETITINSMFNDYEKMQSHPASYTIDIGVIHTITRMKTAIIEIHPFAACGLYGFYDKDIPDMLENGIEWYLKN